MNGTSRADVLSFGGGWQTVAMCVLIVQGKLPRPERIVMADTGRESGDTWEYLDSVVRPLLAPLGLDVEIAAHSLATVDLYSHKGKLLLPVFTATGKLETFCSNEWKQRVVGRYLRTEGYGPDRPVAMWFGFTTDEAHRMKDSDLKWLTNRYPLAFDVPMTRAECRSLILDAGLPAPLKSACWMCSYRNNEEWRQVRARPADWQAAIRLDSEIRQRDKQGGVYLHRSLVPLAEANIDAPDTEQGEIFECVGGCWT